MLAKRVIPSILCRGKTAYKGQRFESTRSIGSAIAVAQTHARRGVDELMILDVSATAEGRGPDLDLVRELSEGCFIPITVGGGVRSLRDIDALLRAGADKVAICTAARTDHLFIQGAAYRFGCQAIVGVCEYGEHRCTALGWAKRLYEMGCGELMLQSRERDGVMEGYDLDLIRAVSTEVSIPVIASGGCGSYADMLAAFKAGADACAAGAMFAFTDSTPKGASQFLRRNGLCVRL